MVLVGLLAPVGVLASWNAIKTRRKIFYSLFLVQQTAMFGVFISLDLMLYYGFWELSLVPMAILIAMYGRKDGPKAALKFFLFTFIPSAPLLVAILWLYARPAPSTSPNCSSRSPAACFPPARSSGSRWRFSSPLPSRCPCSRCTAGSPTHSVKRPSPWRWWWPASWAFTPCCASMSGSSLCRPRHAPLLIVLARHRHPVRRVPGAGAARLLAAAGLRALSHLSLIILGIYGLTFTGWDGAVYQILNHGVVDAALFVLLGALESPLRHQPDCSLRRPGRKLPRTATYFVIASLAMIGLPMLNGFIGEFLILSSTFTGVSRGWAIAAALGVILGAAYMLWLVQRLFYGPRERTCHIEAARPI